MVASSSLGGPLESRGARLRYFIVLSLDTRLTPCPDATSVAGGGLYLTSCGKLLPLRREAQPLSADDFGSVIAADSRMKWRLSDRTFLRGPNTEQVSAPSSLPPA